MADYKRFNTSTSNDYNVNATHSNGTLVWNDNFGIRLHDGETPGGDPLLSLHNWNDPFSPSGAIYNAAPFHPHLEDPS